MLSKEEIIATPEWQALNKLWKTMSAAQRSTVQEEFHLLTDFVKQNVGKNPATDYLNELSPEARKFLEEQKQAGEPSLYHSFLSLIGGSLYEKKEDALAFYKMKYGRSRPYIAEHPDEVEEILTLAWEHQLSQGFQPGKGF